METQTLLEILFYIRKKLKNIQVRKNIIILDYRGPEDKIHGDFYNQSVRQAASEAISAVFERNDSQNMLSKKIEGQGFNPGMQGLSNQGNYDNQPISSFQNMDNSGGMITVQNNKGGIGPVYEQEKNETLMEKIKSKMPSMPTSIWPFGKKGEKPEYKSFNGEGVESFKQHLNTQIYQPPQLTTDVESKQFESYRPDPTWNPQVKSEKTQPKFEGIKQWEEKSDLKGENSIEFQIVEKYTGNSGVRTIPTKEQLAEFCTRCQTVNSDSIAAILDQKLQSQTWQVKNKALYCIEALIKAKNEKVTKYFTENADNIAKETQSQTEALQTKSIKIMKLLNKDIEVPITRVETKKVVEQPKEVKKVENSTSLIDIDDVFTVKNEVKQQESPDDLFEGLSVKDSPEPMKQETKSMKQEEKKSDPKSDILSSFFGSSGNDFVPPPKINSPKATNVVYSHNYPHQNTGSPQIIYVVQQPMSKSQLPRNVNPIPQQKQNQSFDFLNNNNTKSSNDSHFDFIKDEIAQKTKN